MTEQRYKELLEAGPPITKGDFAWLKQFRLVPKPMVLAVLLAFRR